MYKISDKVMHQREGACYITQKIDMKMNNSSKEYYVLQPILNEKSSIYISVDQEKQDSIRPVITQTELRNSEDSLKSSDSEWTDNTKERYRLFENSISSFNFQTVLHLYKCLIMQTKKGNLAVKDKEFLLRSEKLIGSEIAILLDKNYEHVLTEVKKHILD